MYGFRGHQWIFEKLPGLLPKLVRSVSEVCIEEETRFVAAGGFSSGKKVSCEVRLASARWRNFSSSALNASLSPCSGLGMWRVLGPTSILLPGAGTCCRLDLTNFLFRSWSRFVGSQVIAGKTWDAEEFSWDVKLLRRLPKVRDLKNFFFPNLEDRLRCFLPA